MPSIRASGSWVNGRIKTLSLILANAGADGIALQRSMLWSQTRVVMFQVGVTTGFCEFGPTGYSQYSLDQWPLKEDLSTVWNVRKLPLITKAWTKASLV